MTHLFALCLVAHVSFYFIIVLLLLIRALCEVLVGIPWFSLLSFSGSSFQRHHLLSASDFFSLQRSCSLFQRIFPVRCSDTPSCTCLLFSFSAPYPEPQLPHCI
ncbi:hypothetical protein BJX96DRAFT_150496 [Aspergillus floccosus]